MSGGVTLDNWQAPPVNRWSFLHVDEVLPTAVVRRGDGPVLVLADAPRMAVPGLDGFLDRTCTDGFLVLCGSDVVVEAVPVDGFEPGAIPRSPDVGLEVALRRRLVGGVRGALPDRSRRPGRSPPSGARPARPTATRRCGRCWT